MKKSVFMAAVAVMAAFLVGCKPEQEVKTYPDNLNGYWASKANSYDEWISLEVGDNVAEQTTAKKPAATTTTQALLAFHADGRKTSQLLDMNYDSTTGKGELTAEGHTITVQAQNDTTILMSTTTGDTTTLYKGIKPVEEEAPSLVACWQRIGETENNYYDNLLIYPEDNEGVMHATFFVEKNGMAVGVGATVNTYDELEGTGTLFVPNYGETGEANFSLVGDTLTIGNEWQYITKESSKSIAVSTTGTWTATLMQFINITATVNDDNTCTIVYSMPEALATQWDFPTADTISGNVYYNPYVARGAFEYGGTPEERTDDTTTDDDTTTQSSGTSVLFDAVTETQVKISLNISETMGDIELVFNKK